MRARQELIIVFGHFVHDAQRGSKSGDIQRRFYSDRSDDLVVGRLEQDRGKRPH